MAMYQLTYQDSYQVERTLEFENYEELMLSLSGCVTLPDTFLVTSLTFDDKVIYQGLVGDLYRFLSQAHFSDKN
ncbi:ribose-phosphate pyrophosphokinase [Streptococcus oralis subsp. tigurinus 2425]|uniref:Ribose-phosphate pyrophosphokinase n=2 Tax=Streptococcus TaxID=1301 RepID=S9RFW9_STROR|nr:ribose-phosphate pyrophosphokinase [Streptococcus oralis subsp. tigurinus 2425]EPX90782.1 ribose-phosphate pyrophosphokinase [Streptococcus oralis subsp. tigurinus 2426]